MPLMMDGFKRRPQLLQWVVALLMLTLLLGGLGPVFAQDSTGGSSNGSGSIATRECDPPNRCFSSVEARQDYAAQNSCYFLEDVCTEPPSGGGNEARDEDRGFWGQLWDAGVGAIRHGYDFVRGLMVGLGDQLSDLYNLASDPMEAARGLVELGRRFYDNPQETLRSLAQVMGQEAVDMVTRASRCGPFDTGRVLGQNVNPMVVVRLGTRLARFGGSLDDAVAATRRDFGCASFVAGTPVWLPDGRRNIEQIRVGDLVASRDEKTWSDAPQQVGQLFGRSAPEIWELTTEQESIRLTDNHPVWVQGTGWTEAKEVTAGQVLASASGDTVVLSNRVVDGGVRVFNFSVENTPNYFVGEQGLWVHNQQTQNPCLLPIPGVTDRPVQTDADGRAPELRTPEINTRYIVNGGQQVYITDSIGRPVEATAIIDQNTVRLARDRCAQGRAGRACGVPGQDDGGHMIGHQLGGVGEDVNLVGQLRGVNRGGYRVFENELRDLADQGNVITMTVRPQYNGSNRRPDSIEVEYSVNGGPARTRTFENIPDDE